MEKGDGMKLRLKQLRTARGMTQADVAQALGISKSTVGMYEQGRREPDLETVVQMAKLFSVSVEEILGLQDESEPTELLPALRQYLSHCPAISFQGKRLTEEEIGQLTRAIEISVAVAMSEQGKEEQN